MTAMFSEPSHHADVDLAEQCLSGSARAIAALRKKHAGTLRDYLKKTGASADEAGEIVETLWTDCLVDAPAKRARLRTYRGECALGVWLKRVALHAVIDRRRWARRREMLAETLVETGAAEPDSAVEGSVLELMKNALSAALALCPAEDIVRLQLVYLGGLKQGEVAQMWACSESEISKVLNKAMRRIKVATLRFLQKADGAVEMRWQDFLELCDGAGSFFFQ